MRMSTRTRGLRSIAAVVSVAVLASLAAVGCGSAANGDGDPNVDVDLEVPRGEDYLFDLSDAVDTSASGQGSSRTERNGRTRLQFTGVAVDGESFSVQFGVDAVEGETGAFRAVQTSQLTYGSSTYKTQSLEVAFDSYGDGTLVGAVEGAFEQKVVDGETTELSPPVQIEGRFDFQYE